MKILLDYLSARKRVAGPLAAALSLLATSVQAGTITGRVFEDVNYGGGQGATYAAAAGSTLLGGVRVELYRNSGGTYVFAAATATGTSTTSTTPGTALGTYTFLNLTAAANTYVVRVASHTLVSGRGAAGPLPVVTYRTTVNGSTVSADHNYVGGQNPTLGDADSNTNGATLGSLTTGLTTALVQAPIVNLPTGSGTAQNVDFGFSFDVITNTNDAGQGSLRQFILNANALTNAAPAFDQRPFANNSGQAVGQDFPAGQETAIFMLADGTARPGLRAGLPNQLTDISGAAATTGSRALISLANGLDAVTDAGTCLDGTTQTTLSNSNPALLGTGGTVGSDNIALSQLAGPEVEVTAPTAAGTTALTIAADNCTVRGLALHGGGSDFGDASLLATDGVTGLLVQQCGIGIGALALALPTVGETQRTGLYLLNATGQVNQNIIAYCGASGLLYAGGSGTAGYVITQNEFAQNGQLVPGGDNITLGRADGYASMASGVTIAENLLREANSSGIQLEIGAIANNFIFNNTIADNGRGGAASRLEGSGIHYLLRTDPGVALTLSSNFDEVSKNVIHSNQSSGVVINYGQRNVHLTQNAIYGNGDGTTGGRGLIAIDFTPATYYVEGGNRAYGQGDGVTPNDGTLSDDRANKGMNYPIITRKSVTTSGTTTTLYVEGFVGTRAGQAQFAGTAIEFYRGDNSTDANQNGEVVAGDGQSYPHGEPRTYLGTLTTGSTGTFAGDISFPTANVSPALQTADPLNAIGYLPDLGTSESGINLIPNTIQPGVLPVTLVSFAAQCAGPGVQLNWRTASEVHNQGFEVQQSFDGRAFTTLGFVAGAGSSATAHSYAFAAPAPTGLTYYRLRQVDADGTGTYSPVATLATCTPALTPGLQLLPNPAHDYVRVLGGDTTSPVQVFDATGRLLREQASPVAVVGLSPGLYLVRSGTSSARLVVE